MRNYKYSSTYMLHRYRLAQHSMHTLIGNHIVGVYIYLFLMCHLHNTATLCLDASKDDFRFIVIPSIRTTFSWLSAGFLDRDEATKQQVPISSSVKSASIRCRAVFFGWGAFNESRLTPFSWVESQRIRNVKLCALTEGGVHTSSLQHTASIQMFAREKFPLYMRLNPVPWNVVHAKNWMR